MDELSNSRLDFSSEEVKMISSLATVCSQSQIDVGFEDHELTTLNCLNEFSENNLNKISQAELNSIILSVANVNNVMVKSEDVVKSEMLKKTTDDESMAVEALRQLGGMFGETEDDLFSCSLCGLKFESTNDFNSHTSTCKNNLKVSYNCGNCNFDFSNRQQFDDHGCNAQKVYACKFCSDSFFEVTQLKLHMDVKHSGARPFKCHDCSLEFPRLSNLSNHMKIHTYQPGRALLTGTNDTNAKNISKLGAQGNEVYVAGLPNRYIPDGLTNWNLGYDSVDPLVEENLNIPIDEDSLQQNDVSPFDINPSQVKMEAASYPIDIENQLDEQFSIGMPQIELVTSDAKRPHVCPHCDISFSREKALSSHIKMHIISWSGVHECENCSEVFQNLPAKLQHKKYCLIQSGMFNTANDPDFSQPAISAAQKDPSDLDDYNKGKESKAEAKVSLPTGKYSCPDCEKRFTTKQKMFRHRWIHRKKTYTCELCSKMFETQTELDQHRLSSHPADSPFKCYECGKCFSSRQGLWEHGRLHGENGGNVFACKICSKTFSSRQGYLIHNRTHTGERPYGCRFCMKAFRDGGTLRKHERIHTGERPHVCPICRHDFNQKVVLREHIRWVHVAGKLMTDNGLFSCQICSVTVGDREELCAHLVKHSDKMAAEVKGNSQLSKSTNRTRRRNLRQNTQAVKEEVAEGNDSNSETIEEDDKDEMSGVIVYGRILNEKDILNVLDLPTNEKVVCDMCGSNFESQKELMGHVHIHI